jgi:phosphatidylglycerol---prolipoprotein diacylglyceryl transferase
MHPIFLELGPITIRWYGLMAAIGFLAAYWFFKSRAARLGMSSSEASNLLILLFISGIAGARIYYVIWNWEQFAGNPVEIFLINRGGLVFYGGFILAIVALVVWARVRKQKLADLFDALAIPLAVGHGFGRLGCFMNGCCYGRETSLGWAIHPNAPPEVAGLPLHPTQLYEAFGIFYIAFCLTYIEKFRRYPGSVAGTYLILYALLRFIVEFFRGDVPHDVLGRFTLAQTVCMGLFIVAWLLSARQSYRAAIERRRIARENLQSEESNQTSPPNSAA